eukprot:352497-Chlamydomonas_euryale.AAC.2
MDGWTMCEGWGPVGLREGRGDPTLRRRPSGQRPQPASPFSNVSPPPASTVTHSLPPPAPPFSNASPPPASTAPNALPPLASTVPYAVMPSDAARLVPWLCCSDVAICTLRWRLWMVCEWLAGCIATRGMFHTPQHRLHACA